MKMRILNFKIKKSMLLPAFVLLFFGASLNFTFAATVGVSQVAPPLITLAPKSLGNDELWYLGGTSNAPNADVIIYLQNGSGETQSFSAHTDDKGNWFYSHNVFLKEGRYTSWAQIKADSVLSPPSPEVSFDILPTALRLGALRVSYATLYLWLAALLFVMLIVVAGLALYHFRNYHIKNAKIRKEIREAEDEARRGFALLRKDIQAELAIISQTRISRALTMEEHRREEKLMADLDFVENHVMKEIGDIEPAIV